MTASTLIEVIEKQRDDGIDPYAYVRIMCHNGIKDYKFVTRNGKLLKTFEDRALESEVNKLSMYL